MAEQPERCPVVVNIVLEGVSEALFCIAYAHSKFETIVQLQRVQD